MSKLKQTYRNSGGDNRCCGLRGRGCGGDDVLNDLWLRRRRRLLLLDDGLSERRTLLRQFCHRSGQLGLDRLALPDVDNSNGLGGIEMENNE